MAEKYDDWSADKKMDLVYLLMTRYNSNATMCAITQRVDTKTIREWHEKYSEQVNKMIVERFGDDSDANRVPTVDELKKKILVRLNKVVDSAKDVSSLAKAIQYLDDMQSRGGDKGKEDEDRSIVSKIKAMKHNDSPNNQ